MLKSSPETPRSGFYARDAPVGQLESASVLQLIYNPTAGRGRAPASLRTVLRLLDQAGATYELQTSTGPGHATELAAATPPSALVVAVGGDGTVHEVVRGLVLAESGSRLPIAERRTLGVLPIGSGDDFAFAIGLRRNDLTAAVARLLDPRPQAIDLGWVNGKPFVNALGIGFDAEVADRLERAPAFLKGLAAYLYAVLISLGRSRPTPVRVLADGLEVYNGRSLLVAAQNGPRTGGSFLFAPAARNDDGLLDVVVAGDISLAGTLALLPRVMRGAHLGHPQVEMVSCRSLTLEWSDPRHAHTEGEPLGAHKNYEVSVEPAGLMVLGPPGNQ